MANYYIYWSERELFTQKKMIRTWVILPITKINKILDVFVAEVTKQEFGLRQTYIGHLWNSKSLYILVIGTYIFWLINQMYPI